MAYNSDDPATKTERKKLEAELEEVMGRYLRHLGHLDDEWMVTNWMLITAQTSLAADDFSAISYCASLGTPFWQQGGMLDYILQRHHAKIGTGGEDGDE